MLPDRMRPNLCAHYAQKIDCEDCEYYSLLPWLDEVCTEQIVVELHRSTTGAIRTDGAKRTMRNAAKRRVILMHRLMSGLHERGYAIYYVEPNVRFPWLNSEYSLIRRNPCRKRSEV